MQPMLSIPNPQDWVDTKQAAEMIGCSKGHTFNLATKGKITAHHIGGVRIFWRAEIRAFAEAYRLMHRPPRPRIGRPSHG